MATDVPSPSAGTARPWLFVLLGLAVIAFAVMQFGGGAADRPPVASQEPRRTRTPAQAPALDPSGLDVRLEALEAPRPEPAGDERNPFRFRPRAASRPAAPERSGPEPPQVQVEPVRPPPPPAAPPIPLKFIGVVEAPGVGKLAALSDCRFTFRGREGDVIDGRYRLVRIGVESVVVEHVDGTGRTTIRLSGQECVGPR